jgi:hypothetical protein
MSVYDQLMARFKRPNKTSLTRQEAVAPTPGQAASNLSAPPLNNGTTPAATIPASSVRAGRRVVDVNKAKDPDKVKENMELINGGVSSTTDETTLGAGSVKPTSHSVEVHDAQAPKYDSYDRILEFLQANQVADADADARAKRREMFASIGDGISAVSSLYQTTKGAPVTYTPGADMSQAMRDRYDRMIAQRKADSDKYLNYLRVQQAREQAEEKAKRDEQRAQQQADHQRAQERYWDEQAKRWANADEVARQKAAEQERSNKAKEAETERTHKANEAIRDKSRQDQKTDRAANRAQRDRQFNQREANKDKRAANSGNKNKPAGGNTGGKKHKQNPYG